MNEIRPSSVKVIGTLANVSSVDSASHEAVANDSKVITLLNGIIDDEPKGFMELWLSDTMITEFGFTPILFNSNVIHAICNQHIAGVTTYVDSVIGEIKQHTKDGLVITRLYNGTDDDIDVIGVSDRAYNRLMDKRESMEEAFLASNQNSRKDRFYLAKTSDRLDIRIENLQTQLAHEGNSVARIQSIQKAIDSLLDQKNATSAPKESSAEPKGKKANQAV